MNKDPITLNVKSTDLTIYNEISKTGPLKKSSTKELFLLAAVLGFRKGNRVSIRGSKKSYVRVEYLKNDDICLINSIAIKETGEPNIINNKKEVFRIIEEYAHAGLQTLRQLIFQKEGGSFSKRFESYLRECYKNQK